MAEILIQSLAKQQRQQKTKRKKKKKTKKQNKARQKKNEGLDVYVEWKITFNRLIFIFFT